MLISSLLANRKPLYACLCALLASCTGTKSLHVATTGSDINPGTAFAPVLTIARADELAHPGYTIHVAPGTYRVNAPSAHSAGIRTSRSGTAAARIKFVSSVKGAARIVVSGTGIAWHSKGDYVDIDGFDISGEGRHGILASGANLTITNNFIHDLAISGGCTGAGGSAIDTDGAVGNVLIKGNVVRNIGYAMLGACNTVQGIYIASPNNTVTQNIVSRVAAVGITQWHGATGSTILNNTVFHSKVGILLGQGDAGTTATGSENNYVANNLVYCNKTYGIVEGGKMGENNRYADNHVARNGKNWSVKGSVSGAVSADPVLVKHHLHVTDSKRSSGDSPSIEQDMSSKLPTADNAGALRLRGVSVETAGCDF
jgi:hypothetical protein